MAGIDYSIPGQIRPIQVESPMNAMAQAMQLRGLQESSQMNALRMQEQALKAQEYQRGVESRNKLALIHADPKVKIGSPEYLERVYTEVPDLYNDVATKIANRENVLSQIEMREAAANKSRFDLDKAKKEQEQNIVDYELKQFNDQFPTYNLQSEQDVEDRIVAMSNNPTLSPLLTRFGTLGDTIARNKAEFRRDPRNYVARTSGMSAEKIFQAIEEKENKEYSNYRLNEILNRRQPLTQEAYFKRNRGEAVTPVAAVDGATSVAAPVVTADATASTEKNRPVETPVIKEDRAYGVDLLDPDAQAMYMAAASEKDPIVKDVYTKLGEKIQTESAARNRNREYTGTFQNVDIALRELERLKKESKTPENEKRIEVLEGLIAAAQIPQRPPAPTEISKKENELDELQVKLTKETDPNKKKTLKDRIARLRADISGDVYGREKTPATTPAQDALISKAILDGRLDPGKVNSRNITTIAKTLEMDPNANLKELSIDAMSGAASSKTLAVSQAKILTAANEANNMIKITRNVSTKLDLTQYPTLNAIQNAVDKGTGGKDIVKLNTALNALINSYARAINPSGVATVRDKNHAEALINSNLSSGQLNAALDIMQTEMEAAVASPRETSRQLKEQRNKPTVTAPAVGTIKDGYKFKGGNPADKNNWEKVK